VSDRFRRGWPLRVPGWAERAAERGCKPREFLRLGELARNAMLCTGTAEPSTTMGISWRSSGSACSGGLAGSAAAAAGWLAELLPFLVPTVD
jgi:hypothetical protein